MVQIVLVSILAAIWSYIVYCWGKESTRKTFAINRWPVVRTESQEYEDLTPAPKTDDKALLYLDLMKRALTNILYQDRPAWIYDHHKTAITTDSFDLKRRTMGEDAPTEAHTMIGLRRLENIQHCVECAIKENIPGDLVETGVGRGGACIFMKSLLKAYNERRKIYVCDTFVGPKPPMTMFLRSTLVPFIRFVASVTTKSMRMRLFKWMQKGVEKGIEKGQEISFPKIENPYEDEVEITFYLMRNLYRLGPAYGTALEDVKSNFSRYGLLDDSVIFLKGFFADTIPTSSIDQLAVLRADGDTFESTWDALRLLYSKVVVGGFVIIDDYHSFSSCKEAVDKFREKHKINDEMIAIDNLAVYWRKSKL